MNAVFEMRKDIVELKEEVEEKLAKGDETKTIVLQLAQTILKKLHTNDKKAVIDLKSEAFDEIRHLKKMEEKIKSAVLELNSSKEPSPEMIERISSLSLEIEKMVNLEKDLSLSVGVRKTSAGIPCDSVYLKNMNTDPDKIRMCLDNYGKYIGIKIEPTHETQTVQSLKHLQFSARGLKSLKQYQKLPGHDLSMIFLHKTDEDLSISVTLFGSNIQNSPLTWSHNEKVIRNSFVPNKMSCLNMFVR